MISFVVLKLSSASLVITNQCPSIVRYLLYSCVTYLIGRCWRQTTNGNFVIHSAFSWIFWDTVIIWALYIWSNIHILCLGHIFTLETSTRLIDWFSYPKQNLWRFQTTHIQIVANIWLILESITLGLYITLDDAL